MLADASFLNDSKSYKKQKYELQFRRYSLDLEAITHDVSAKGSTRPSRFITATDCEISDHCRKVYSMI